MATNAIRVPAGLTTEGLLGKRYMARFIDSVAIAAVGVGMVLLVRAPLSAAAGKIVGMLLMLALAVILWVGYGAAMESSAWQATLGKRLMGLRVYNAEGGRLAPGQAAVRNLVKEGPFLVFGLIPGWQLASVGWLVVHLVVIHRSNVNQAIHDRVAHTWVAAPEQTVQLHLR